MPAAFCDWPVITGKPALKQQGRSVAEEYIEYTQMKLNIMRFALVLSY